MFLRATNIAILAFCFFIISCEEKKESTTTLGAGSIEIAVDETFRPVIEEQLKVFDSSFPDAHVKAYYKAESECIKDFLNEKVRLVLVTRELSSEEKKFCEQHKMVPTSLPLAKDGIAIVLHPSSTDTVLSPEMIKGILSGNYPKKKYTVVFDNQGSSTVRYMMDSLLKGVALGANVFAAKGNDSVIHYVSQNPDAIGFVGVSYAADYSDPNDIAFTNKVKVAEVFNDKLKRAYKPYQAYLANNAYLLTRHLYYINIETYPGLGTGFANFLGRERGQLIFKSARLFPMRSDVIFREAVINK